MGRSVYQLKIPSEWLVNPEALKANRAETQAQRGTRSA